MTEPLSEPAQRTSRRQESGFGRRPKLVHVLTVADSLCFLDGQIAYMTAHGFDVEVVSSPDPLLEQFGQEQQIRTHAIEMPRRISPGRDLLALARLTRLLRRLSPDLVHAHTPKGGLLGALAAASAGIPIRIYHMRGLPMSTATGWRRTLLANTERVACAASHCVLCNSQSLRRTAITEHLCQPSKLKVLRFGSGNGVDHAVRFNPEHVEKVSVTRVRNALDLPNDAPVLGFVGRIVRDKGIGDLLQAWRTLRDRFPRLYLVVVGPFEARDPISATDRRVLESDSRIRVLGFRRDLPELYAMMTLLALPTYREGFPNVLLEAQAMRLPVVATRVDGCVDAIVDGVTGTLVPPADPGALAAAIERYLRDPERRRSHAARGRQYVASEFTPQLIWASMLELYRSELGARAGIRASRFGRPGASATEDSPPLEPRNPRVSRTP